MIVFSFVVIAANFAESQKVALASKIWMGLFTAHTVLLPVFGIVDFSAYDEWEVAGCRSGGDECYEWAEVELETAYGPLVVNTTRGTAQEPPDANHATVVMRTMVVEMGTSQSNCSCKRTPLRTRL